MEITGIAQGGGTSPYIPLLSGEANPVRTPPEETPVYSTLQDNLDYKIYTKLPVAKTAQLHTAERVHYICHCCGKLIWTDESRVITTGRGESGIDQKVTIEHSLCKQCKQDYLGWD